MLIKVWDEIAYPFFNSNGATVEVSESKWVLIFIHAGIKVNQCY